MLLEDILKVKIYEVNYLNLEMNVDNVHVRRKHFHLNLFTNICYIQVMEEIKRINEDGKCAGIEEGVEQVAISLMNDGLILM